MPGEPRVIPSATMYDRSSLTPDSRAGRNLRIDRPPVAIAATFLLYFSDNAVITTTLAVQENDFGATHTYEDRDFYPVPG